MAYDFGTYYQAAQCWLQGQSPYACAGFFYPLPTLFLFLPFAAFPYPIARAIWFGLLLLAFVVTLRRRALWYILYVPTLQAAYLGQVDLLLLPLVAAATTGRLAGTGPAMAILTLKPQLIWLYLPLWFVYAPARERRAFLLVAGGLWGASLLAWPAWSLEFLSTTRPLSQAAYASPSLWAGGLLPWWTLVPLAAALVYVSRNRFAALTAANPALISYDLVILLPRAKWWLVPLSWLTQAASLQFGAAWPHALLPLAAAALSIRYPSPVGPSPPAPWRCAGWQARHRPG